MRYFNRVRLAAGLLAILVAIGVILPEALGGAVIIEAAAGLAASLNLILPGTAMAHAMTREPA